MGISGIPLDKKEILDAIEKNHGVILHVAASLGCIPRTIYDWISRDKDVKDAVDLAREVALQERIDRNEIFKKKAYDSVEKLLDKNDVTQTIFTLKHLCGWTEGTKEHSIVINKIERPYNDKTNSNSS